MMILSLLILAAAPATQWKPVAPGAEYRAFAFDPSSTLHVVRIDPAKARLKFGLSSHGGAARTAARWAADQKFAVVINAGMFSLEDHRSNVGRLVDGAHVNQGAWNEYRSVLAFGAKKPGLPGAQVV